MSTLDARSCVAKIGSGDLSAALAITDLKSGWTVNAARQHLRHYQRYQRLMFFMTALQNRFVAMCTISFALAGTCTALQQGSILPLAAAFALHLFISFVSVSTSTEICQTTATCHKDGSWQYMRHSTKWSVPSFVGERISRLKQFLPDAIIEIGFVGLDPVVFVRHHGQEEVLCVWYEPILGKPYLMGPPQ